MQLQKHFHDMAILAFCAVQAQRQQKIETDAKYWSWLSQLKLLVFQTKTCSSNQHWASHTATTGHDSECFLSRGLSPLCVELGPCEIWWVTLLSDEGVGCVCNLITLWYRKTQCSLHNVRSMSAQRRKPLSTGVCQALVTSGTWICSIHKLVNTFIYQRLDIICI